MDPKTGEIPHIIIEPDANEDIARRIRFFDKLAHEKPVELQLALFALGEAATAQTIDYSSTHGRKTSLKRSPREFLTEFFTQRYDNEFTYDPATATAMQQDQNFTKLSKDLDTANLSRKSIEGNNPDRIEQADARSRESRDALRRYKVAFYLRRVIYFTENAKKQAESQLELRNVS